MVNMKIDLKGSGVDVNKKSGFEPYEGPLPTPGVYAATIASCKVRVSQAGNPYFNVMYEFGDQLTDDKQKFKGYPLWDRVVPGESDIQKERVGKLLHLVSGKDPAKVNVGVDHEEVTDGGKVNKIGGKDPVGTRARVTLRRSSNNGEVTCEVMDVFPWPKDTEWPDGSGDPESAEAEDEPEEEEPEEPESDEEESEEEEEESDEGEDEEEEGDDEVEARQTELRGMTRTQVKALLKEADSEFRVLKKHSDEDLIDALLDLEFGEEVEEGESEGPPF